MAQKLDNKELVHLREFMMASPIQLDAVTQLLIEKGIITEETLFAQLKGIQAEYGKKAST